MATGIKRPPELDRVLDYYWGGSERRITGLTVRIIGINLLMLVVLLASIFVLGQYQRTLLEAKLETIEVETKLITAALSADTIRARSTDAEGIVDYVLDERRIDPMLRRLSQETRQRILVFDRRGVMRADSSTYNAGHGVLDRSVQDFSTTWALRQALGFILKALPNQPEFPVYVHPDSAVAEDFPFVTEALAGRQDVTVWHDENGEVLLTISAPLTKDGDVAGALFLVYPAHDIQRALEAAWGTVLKVFLITFVFVVFLSIYFSGVIARPLKKLARAAEGVRRGKLSYADIPDFSERHDEIGELSVVLQQMTRALSDRMDAIESFAADVAHELKNPLTSLRSAIETLGVVKKAKDREKLMEIVRHDIDRLSRLITDISQASKLDVALSRDTLARVNIGEVLMSLLDAHKAPLERDNHDHKHVVINGIHVRVYGTSAPVFVWGVAGRLEQVFQNLLANALSFSPEGGETRISVSKEDHAVRVEIEDQGGGIPENRLEEIFERFYTSRPEHEAYGMHSGLGLSICRQIVEAFGGEIYAENITSQGATGARFTVILNRA